MNKENIIVTINNMKDIDKIKKDTKYINLDINNVNIDVINYFLKNGKDYLYSDSINNVNGFVYATYDMFKNSEKLIDDIIHSIPSDLSNIEKIRYIYIYLGKILSSDINVMEDKNEVISFSNISTINNIWGSLNKRRVTDMSISKIFIYVLSRIGIKSEIVNTDVKSIGNKVYIDDKNFIIVNLFNDLAYIQGGFSLKYFDKYGANKTLDKKFGYIREEYTDYYLNKTLSFIDLLDSNVVYIILSVIERIISIDNIGSMELSQICKIIFDKYLPSYDVIINNFYYNNGIDKSHFIVINYGDDYYTYNYNCHKFIRIKYEEIYKNLEDNLIGLYNSEDFIRNKKEVLV